MSNYPYTGQLSANVGGGLGGLPVRRSAVSSAVSKYTKIIVIEHYVSVDSYSGTIGRNSCLKLDNGDFLLATLTSSANISLKRFSSNPDTNGVNTVTPLGSTVNTTVIASGASALLCHISPTKCLLVGRSSGTNLNAWNVDISSGGTPSVGSAGVIASTVIPVCLIRYSGTSALLIGTVSGSGLVAFSIDASGATPVITSLTLAGSNWLSVYGTNDDYNSVSVIKLTDSTFVIGSQSLAQGYSSNVQGLTLSGTTLTRSSVFNVKTNTATQTNIALCKISDTLFLTISPDQTSQKSEIKAISFSNGTLSSLNATLVGTAGGLLSLIGNANATNTQLILLTNGDILVYADKTTVLLTAILRINSDYSVSIISKYVYRQARGYPSQINYFPIASDETTSDKLTFVTDCAQVLSLTIVEVSL